jgi:putative ABC transport system permease protein
MKRILLSLRFAIKTIVSHKARTILALLGVVIGVFSVVVVMSLGDGVKSFVLGQVESFGGNVIQVEVKVPSTGAMSSDNASSRGQGTQITTLVVDDKDAIKKLPNVTSAYAGTIGQERATYGSIGKRILLFGASYEVPIVDQKIVVEEGRFYSEDEANNGARVVVLGAGVKETFFGTGDALGESITMKGEKYRVVGVLESRGSAGFFDLDSLAYVPVETLQKKILGVDYVQMISVQVDDMSKEEQTVADIVGLLRRQHDITNPDKDDFSVTSTKQVQETVNDVLGSLTILLLALTSITLVVGGVGIMNVMYVSVTERTSEIGLRKALGATSQMVLIQFLLEALIITLLGGIAGIILGVLATLALGAVFQSLGFDFTLSFSWSTLALGAGFSLLVGIIFGIAPAYRAAKLSPMEALRKE